MGAHLLHDRAFKASRFSAMFGTPFGLLAGISNQQANRIKISPIIS